VKTQQPQLDLAPLEELQDLRGRKAILYSGMIHGESLPALYKCLQQLGKMDELDLVLKTTGGEVVAARRFALLLHEFAKHLTILVPYRAWSAGTLVCLSADELIIGPLAELGAVDPQIGSHSTVPHDAPSMISAEDVRQFKAMARAWFGVTKEEDHIQLLALLAQRIFPTTLTTFYRSDLLVRKVIRELLNLQNQGLESSAIESIEKALVEDTYAHDYTLNIFDLAALGLPVTSPVEREETLLWELSETCRELVTPDVSVAERGILGIIATTQIEGFYEFDWKRVSSDMEQGRSQRHMEMFWTFNQRGD
jgi:Serine dehydrogenase proteinase